MVTVMVSIGHNPQGMQPLQTRRESQLPGDVVLTVDVDNLYLHQALRKPVPTVMIHFKRGTVSQRAAEAAAKRIRYLHVTCTERQVQLSTSAKVMSPEAAFELYETFVYELEQVLKARKTAEQRSKKGMARGGYRNWSAG